MANLKLPEILIILAIVLLLFGSKKLPDAARGIGRSLRIFKAETKGLMEDDKQAVEGAASSAPAAAESTSEGPFDIADAPAIEIVSVHEIAISPNGTVGILYEWWDWTGNKDDKFLKVALRVPVEE